MVGEIIPWVIWWVHVRLLLLLRGNLKSIATVLKVWWRLLLLHILLLILLKSHFIWIHLFTFPSPFSHIIGLDWFLGCDLVSRIRRNSVEKNWKINTTRKKSFRIYSSWKRFRTNFSPPTRCTYLFILWVTTGRAVVPKRGREKNVCVEIFHENLHKRNLFFSVFTWTVVWRLITPICTLRDAITNVVASDTISGTTSKLPNATTWR